MKVVRDLLGIAKEAGRHLLRRPVVGIAAAATCPDGRWLLIRRPSGLWAMPGGTLEWGEMLEPAILRELEEEAGVETLSVDGLIGVYSDPDSDDRFHAVTVLVRTRVGFPTKQPKNSVEIRGVQLFTDDELPHPLAYGMSGMLADARSGRLRLA